MGANLPLFSFSPKPSITVPNHFMKLSIFLTTLLLLLVFVPNKILSAPQLIHDADAMQVKVYRLDNGLTVYLSRNTQTPRFYAEVAVRAGRLTDPSDNTGLAHYLEHLMFKGTQKMGTLDYQKEKPHLDKVTELYEQHTRETDPEKRKLIYQKINEASKLAAQYAVANDIDRIYKAMGGTGVNAHTHYEETIYKVDLPANQLERWAKIEHERFSNPVFRLFHTELESVYEEKNTSLDNGKRRFSEAVAKLLYPDHPYGSQTTLGKSEHLKNPSLVKIREYFDQYYVPENMAIIISGDIVLDDAIKVIDESFGTIANSGRPPRQATAPAPLKKGVSKTVVSHEGEESVILAWRTTSNSHADAHALTMLDMILDNTVAGLINLNLVSPQLVRSAGSYPSHLNEGGAQYLWGSPRENQSLEEVEALLLEQIQHIKEGKFEEWLIPAIVSDLQTNLEESYESNEGRVELIRDSFISQQSWAETSQSISRLATVTREDIIRVANQYFGDTYVVGHLVKGKPNIRHIEKPQIDAMPLNASSESPFSKEILAMGTSTISPYFPKEGKDFQKSTTDNGVQYFTTLNPINNLFTVTWSFPKGTLHDDLLPITFDLLAKSGTSELSSIELDKRWYQLGVKTLFSVTEDRTEISLSGLSSSYEPAVKLFWQWINEMTVEQSVLDNLVSDLKISRKDAMDDPATITHAMARHSRYGKKSIYLNRASHTELDQLTVSQLQKIAHNLIKLPHQVSYIGKLSEPQWRELTPALEVTEPTPAPILRPVSQTSSPVEIHFYERDMAQARIWIEHELEGLSEDKATILNLFNEYFDGGMSGIVFQEIRESRGLAYSAFGYLTSPRWEGDPHLAIGSVACQADKVDKALGKFLQLFDELPTSDVRFTESNEAITSRLRTKRSDFRSRVATIQQWQRRGINYNLDQRIFDQTPKIDHTGMLQFYKKSIKTKPKRVCILGDSSRIDLEALKKFGPVKIIQAEDIFTQ